MPWIKNVFYIYGVEDGLVQTDAPSPIRPMMAAAGLPTMGGARTQPHRTPIVHISHIPFFFFLSFFFYWCETHDVVNRFQHRPILRLPCDFSFLPWDLSSRCLQCCRVVLLWHARNIYLFQVHFSRSMWNKITEDKSASNRWQYYTNQYTAIHYARENRRNFFSIRIVNTWNSLPAETTDFSGLDKFNKSVSNMFLLNFCQVNFVWMSPCNTETYFVCFFYVFTCMIVLFLSLTVV